MHEFFQGLSHVHRSLVKNPLQQIVNGHLLLADYSVLTSTNHPIFCYIKVVPKLNNVTNREMLIQSIRQHNITFEGYMMLNTNHSLSKGNRLHPSEYKVLSVPSYIAMCGGPQEQLNLQASSIVQNRQRNISDLYNIATSQNRIQHPLSPVLSDIEHLQHISDCNNRRKRSFTTRIIDSSSFNNNNVFENNKINRSIRQSNTMNTLSTTSIPSEETLEQVSIMMHNSGTVLLLSFSFFKKNILFL